MRVHADFYSYLKDLAGCSGADFDLPAGSTVGELLVVLYQQFPQLAPMAKSTLVAVGVEYRLKDHRLADGDQVSLFPPVQGG